MNLDIVVLSLDKRLDNHFIYDDLRTRFTTNPPRRYIVGDGEILPPFDYNHIDIEIEGRKQAYNYTICIHKILKSSYKDCIWLIEDDAVLTHRFDSHFKLFVEEFESLNRSFDVLFVGGNHVNGPCEQISTHIIKPRYSLDLHSVIFHRKAFEKLLSIEPSTCRTFDGVVADMQKNGQLEVYAFHPSLLTQRSGVSGNENEVKDRRVNHFID